MESNFKHRNRGKQLKFVRECRGYTQQDVCENINSVTTEELVLFEKGLNSISDDKLELIMIFLNWPFSFLDERSQTISMLQI